MLYLLSFIAALPLAIVQVRVFVGQMVVLCEGRDLVVRASAGFSY